MSVGGHVAGSILLLTTKVSVPQGASGDHPRGHREWPSLVHCRVLNANSSGQRLDHLLTRKNTPPAAQASWKSSVMWDFTLAMNAKALYKSVGSRLDPASMSRPHYSLLETTELEQ